MCLAVGCYWTVLFFKQKTAYEMRISDWSSDVCSSDLGRGAKRSLRPHRRRSGEPARQPPAAGARLQGFGGRAICRRHGNGRVHPRAPRRRHPHRSEEHTSELQSLMRISYAVFCLKKKNKKQTNKK